ncbi:MAG TPA: glucoamylase family protein [Bacteroidales bacterium]|nr:glucoamylase family protein [Bacteroidales bacterium]
MKITVFFLLLVFSLASCKREPAQQFKSFGSVDFPITAEDEKMLDSIQFFTFQYFLQNYHPEWGIVPDRLAPGAPTNIAASGFALASFAVGVERNWITRERAAQITLNMLNFFANSEQSSESVSSGYRGFYYRFLSMETGKRHFECELSTVDTGLLMMGVLFARNYYNQENETEQEIRRLAEYLLTRIEWEFMIVPEGGEFANTICMGWYPEKGFHHMGWKGYSEALFLYILAAGLGMENAEVSYDAWVSGYKWHTYYEGLEHVAFPPLFGHQFAHAYIDFRGLADRFMREKGICYFENSRRATLSQQRYAIDNPHGWVGYDALTWGVTASDGPGPRFNFNGHEFIEYAGRGATSPEYNYFDDGTIAPYGPLSSLPFAPEVVIPTARNIIERYGDRIWGRFGFYDAFNPTVDWVNSDYIGIAQGPMLMMIENFRTGLVWNYVMKDPIIQKGLSRLGFEYIN